MKSNLKLTAGAHFWLAALSAVAAVIVVFFTFDYYSGIYVEKVTDEAVILTIPPGDSLDQINARMEQAGLLKHRFYWELHVRLNRMSRRLQAGKYEITAEDSLYSIGDKLLNYDVLFNRFTIVEGWTLEQVLSAMETAPGIKMETRDRAAVRRYLNLRTSSAEGMIYPDTYLFPDATSNLSLLLQAYEKMQESLSALWEERTPELPLATPYEALILASIVEKEGGLRQERNRIAGVFVSRLRRGMRLQSDPTVIYGLGENFNGDLKKRHLEKDTAYNTYTRGGLPPTPIAIPGLLSLQAVMAPEITGDLYFVSKQDGSHHFSKTYDKHRQAVLKYQLENQQH